MANTKNPFDLAREKLSGVGNYITGGKNGFLSSGLARDVVNVGSRVQSNPISQAAQPVANVFSQGIKSFNNIGYSNLNPGILLAKQVLPTSISVPVNQPKTTDFTNIAKAGLSGVGFITNPVSPFIGGGVNAIFNSGMNVLAKKPIEENLGKSFGEGVSFSSMFAPFSSLVRPISGKLTSSLAGGRAVQGAINVAEGAAFTGTTGGKYEPLQAGIDFVSGAIGKPFGPRVGVSNFKMDRNTIKELEKAEIILKNPESYADTFNYKTPVAREKAIEGFKKDALEVVDRLAAKYLPNKQLNKVGGDPMKTIKELSILHSQNKLGNTPGMNLVDDKNTEKYSFNVNKDRMKIDDMAKTQIDKTVKDILPELQTAKGAKLSHEEIIQAARTSDVLKRVVTRDETKAFNAALLKTRQAVAAGAEGKGISQDFIDALKIQSSIASDWGRRGNALAIDVDGVVNQPVKNEIVKKLLELGKNTDEIINAAKGVNFDSPKEATAFYRQFVKPNLGEILGEYRYINLLSSPKTHITNTFSNLLQAGVLAPGTKLYSGAVDLIGSSLTGKQRQHYVSEVPAYYKGLFNSVSDAFNKAGQAFKGEIFSARPDIGKLGTGSKLTKLGEPVLRALEASDVFFQTIMKGGHKESILNSLNKSGKKLADSAIDKMASDKAAYFVFRNALDSSNKSGQGKLLSNIDKFTESIYSMRKVPGVSWFIPFVQTPMNILKQGIEYSPLGLATLPGSKDKGEQLSKALMGSTIFAGAAAAVSQGDSTWATPTSEKDKEAFFAANRKPYSIKIGDQWVSYDRLGPIAYPIAMAAAIKYYNEKDPKSIGRSKLENTAKTLSGVAKFFTDQSYLQGVGDLLKTLQGDQSAAQRSLTNIPTQLIPMNSLVGWVSRLIDPIYRKSSGFVDSIKSDLPFISKTVEPYTKPSGLPSERSHNIINSFSPVGISSGVEGYENYYQNTQSGKKSQEIRDKIKELVLGGNTEGAKKLILENKEELVKGSVSNSLQPKIDKLRKLKDTIRASQTMSEDQKNSAYQKIEDAIFKISNVTNQIGGEN